MHRARIAAGADILRSWRGGPLARLFVSPLILAFLAAPPSHASEDPLEAFFGADYGRQVLPGSQPPPAAIGSLPGFDTTGTDSTAPRLSANASWRKRDLITMSPATPGEFGFAHNRTLATFDVATAAIPGVELRGAADRVQREMLMGDSTVSVGMGDTGWGWRAAATLRLTPWLIPSLIVAGESSTPHGDALEAFAARGSMPFGVQWSMAMGRKRLDFPLRLRLKEYDPISLPMQARQRFAEGALKFSEGPWEAYWSGRITRSGLPRIPPQGYALGDSGSFWRQRARAAYDCLRPDGSGWMASLDFEVGAGNHVFRGRNHKDGDFYPFAWQEGVQKDYSIRADFRYGGAGYSRGGWIAAGESEYDALRPAVAFNHHLWDRNGVIDSYEGTVLGVFNNETWLLNGAAYSAQAGAGLWMEAPFWGWDHRITAGYRYLLLEANSRLTRRETNFILAYTEENFDDTYPTVEADLIPLEWHLSRSWGNLILDMDIRAEIPARVRVTRSGSSGSGSGGESGDEGYSGGTSAGVRVGYRLP